MPSGTYRDGNCPMPGDVVQCVDDGDIADKNRFDYMRKNGGPLTVVKVGNDSSWVCLSNDPLQDWNSHRFNLVIRTRTAPAAVPSPAESPASGGGEGEKEDCCCDDCHYAKPDDEAEDNEGNVYCVSNPMGLPDAPVAGGMLKRIQHLSALLSEAIEIIETPAPELGSPEWVWLIQAAAAFHNKCVLCSQQCDEEGECVSSDCCFGRSKLAQQSAEGIGSR